MGRKLYDWKLLKRIIFRINCCTTCQFSSPKFSNKSDFEPTFCNSSNFESNFLERVRFWINLSTTCQILNRNIYIASDFELKLFSTNQFLLETFLSKNHFSMASKRLNVKNSDFAVSWKSKIRRKQFWKKNFESIFFRKNHNRSDFYNASGFQPGKLKRVRLQVNF